MSTKSTLAHGQGYHLYEDMLERGVVYLEVTAACPGFGFDANPSACCLRLSREALDAILAGIATDA